MGFASVVITAFFVILGLILGAAVSGVDAFVSRMIHIFLFGPFLIYTGFNLDDSMGYGLMVMGGMVISYRLRYFTQDIYNFIE